MESKKQLSHESRYIRQSEIIKTRDITVAVVGVGASGRQVALQLAAMGIDRIFMIDHDLVDLVNLPVQGFRENDIGQKKVVAVSKACREINSNLKIRGIAEKYSPEHFSADVIFSCVDDITVRRKILDDELKKGDCKLIIDSRMSAEVCRVIRCDLTDSDSVKRYLDTFFDPSEAFAERCTSKTTIYGANVSAGLMVAEFARWLRGFNVAHECQLNLLACSFSVSR